MIYIGIDNGISGNLGIITDKNEVLYFKMPVKKVLNYTKTKQFLHRIDGDKFRDLLLPYLSGDSFCLIERPMINPTRFRATISAIRALEATQTIIELLKIPYQFIDSKEWQRELLPKGLEKQELKFAGLEVAKRLFPSVNLDSFDDADGLLIAEYNRRKREIKLPNVEEIQDKIDELFIR